LRALPPHDAQSASWGPRFAPMTDDERLERLDERVERISEQLGSFRLEVREEFGKTRVQIAELRAEVIDRDTTQLKWLLGLFVAQTAALGALMAVFR
jgi:archaellum component FlaC